MTGFRCFILGNLYLAASYAKKYLLTSSISRKALVFLRSLRGQRPSQGKRDDFMSAFEEEIEVQIHFRPGSSKRGYGGV